MRDAASLEPRGESDVRRGDLFPPSALAGGKGGGGGSRGGWYCRDHQSWRIIIAKNKKMVFSSLSNEFLWVPFNIIIYLGERFSEICGNHSLNYIACLYTEMYLVSFVVIMVKRKVYQLTALNITLL